jgi:hypothetical protein
MTASKRVSASCADWLVKPPMRTSRAKHRGELDTRPIADCQFFALVVGEESLNSVAAGLGENIGNENARIEI